MSCIIEASEIVNDFYYFDTIDSTQNYAHKLLENHDGSFIVCAGSQSQGRGRFKRTWESPEQMGLYMSIVWRPGIPTREITKFNYHISLAIARAIRACFDLEVKIKWPNDIYINNKKVCGFLSEMITKDNNIDAIICGIGINLRHSEALKIIKRATSLAHELDKKDINFETFFQSLVEELKDAYDAFINDGFPDIKEEWLSLTNVFDYELTINAYNTSYKAKALSIDKDGFLNVVDREGNIKKVISADIELNSGD